MDAEAELSPAGDLSLEDLVARLRSESTELAEVERVCRAELPLPAGWVWKARLRVAVMGRSWLFRSSVLPERVVAPGS